MTAVTASADGQGLVKQVPEVRRRAGVPIAENVRRRMRGRAGLFTCGNTKFAVNVSHHPRFTPPRAQVVLRYLGRLCPGCDTPGRV